MMNSKFTIRIHWTKCSLGRMTTTFHENIVSAYLEEATSVWSVHLWTWISGELLGPALLGEISKDIQFKKLVFPQFLQGKFRDCTLNENNQRLFLIHNSLINLSFDALQSELLRTYIKNSIKNRRPWDNFQSSSVVRCERQYKRICWAPDITLRLDI